MAFRARNISKGNVDFAIEVKTSHPRSLVDKVRRLDYVTSVSLVEHDGDVTA